jgi:F-type H+-transporting ATPase subunit delta
MVDFRGASADAVETLTAELTAAKPKPATGEGLFAVSQLLRDDAALRRFAADASQPVEAKQGLVGQLFSGKVDETGLGVLRSAVAQRWTASGDLADGLERLSEVAAVASAGGTEQLVDELFDLRRVISGSPELRDALSDPQRSVEDKSELLDTLLGSTYSATTVTLAKQALAGTYGTVSAALSSYRSLAAEVGGRGVATVVVARELTPDQSSRLVAALASMYGRPILTNTVIDPDVVGGVRVEIGDDVIDGTISSRLDEAARLIAS